ncbi:MAG: ADP-heptose--LPS heptosyltransferase [Acidobacteria bacterium]|jgi:heptosyltransferase-1|nr:ADP-heptose--LPS heptosyltransferase [Acidobacteriota bacterium]
MKILIVKLSSIGDIVHTLPVLAAIRSSLPGAEIAWAVEKRSAEILRGNPLLDNLIELDTRSLRGGKPFEELLREAGRQWRELRQFKYDIALDFQGLVKSAAIARFSRVKRRYGFSSRNLREPVSRFLLNETVDVRRKTHIIRKNLELAAKALNISVPDNDFEFPIFAGEEHRAEAENIISQTNGNFAVLNPAGGWATKLWHAEKFGELADKIWEKEGLFSIVTTAPNEKELAEKALRGSKSGKVLLTQPTLKGFYELVKRAKVYVGGDTGPTHLAVAAGAPIVGIFGPTEWWRNGSPNRRDICVERTDIDCRIDCHRRTCSNWICMDMTTDTIFEAVRKRLGKF